jgi:flagellar FliL protein
MSTATAIEGAVPIKAGKKKLVVIALVVLLLLAAVGGGMLFWLKARAHAAALAEEEGSDADHPAAHQRDPNSVPVFVPLDNFTVNLADREAERYAQIGITLELNDSKAGERIKVFMPAIRNNILMVLSHKRSTDLLERQGKEQLAAEIQLETERAIGYEAPPDGKSGHDQRPVRAVQFSNFIIQ